MFRDIKYKRHVVSYIINPKQKPRPLFPPPPPPPAAKLSSRSATQCCSLFLLLVQLWKTQKLKERVKEDSKKMEEDGEVVVTPGEVLGKASDFKAGTGAYVPTQDHAVYASLTGFRRILSPLPDDPDQRPTVEVTGHTAHGPVPEPGSIVIARVTRVMARMASADIMCVGTKSVREKFSGIIRQQDVRATEIDKVDMHLSFRAGDIVRAHVLSLGDARAYYLSTAKNELGAVSAESAAGATMVPINWTEMQCPLTGQVELRKVAKVGGLQDKVE